MFFNLSEVPPEFRKGVRYASGIVLVCESLAVADQLAAWCKQKYPESESKRVYLFASGIWLVVVVDFALGGTDASKTDNA